MTNPNDRRRSTRGNATNKPATSGSTGEPTVQIGEDGAQPAVNLGGGVTMDANGDTGYRIGSGLSADFSSGSSDSGSSSSGGYSSGGSGGSGD